MPDLTESRLAAIRARHLAKSFHDQNWADMELLLADNDRLREDYECLRLDTQESQPVANAMKELRARRGYD